MDKRTADVAIVGAASPEVHWPCGWRAGLAVTVLEQAAEYRDRVRGETMFPWCCAELVESGLLDIAMRAEGTVATRVAPYGDSMSPHDAEASALEATAVVPGVAGMLNFSHPDACRADAGSRRERGGGRSRCTRSAGHRGPEPAVRYRRVQRDEVVHARVVVGADGRGSTVRRQLRIPLATTGPRTFAAGLLVDGLTWPAATDTTGSCEDVAFFIFPRRSGRTRICLGQDHSRPLRRKGRR